MEQAALLPTHPKPHLYTHTGATDQRNAYACCHAAGHDAKIVSSVDFTKYRPDFIMYEHMHLEAAENATALRRVLDAGYRSAFTDSWTSNLAFVRIV